MADEIATSIEKSMWIDEPVHQRLKVTSAYIGVPMKAIASVVLQKFIDDYNRAPGLYPRKMFVKDEDDGKNT